MDELNNIVESINAYIKINYNGYSSSNMISRMILHKQAKNIEPRRHLRYRKGDIQVSVRCKDFESDTNRSLKRKDKMELESVLKNQLDEPWSYCVYNIIEQKGYKESTVYKDAGISKQTFSKIINNKYYQPNKDTAFQMCIGLRLNLDEAASLMAKAGYTLSNSSKRDLIFKYMLENEIYNIQIINDVLYQFDLKLLPIH